MLRTAKRNKFLRYLLSGAVFAACALLSGQAFAGDLTWSGLYRFEGHQYENMELDGIRRRETYMIHHMILTPKIVAADGLTIHARFDLLNSCAGGQGSQVGSVLGHGPDSPSSNCSSNAPSYLDGTTTNGNSNTGSTSVSNSNVFAHAEAPETLQVTQLYLSWVQEFGVFVVGRVPLQFGLGMTYNAGNGQFDHWYDTRDLVGYKVVLGNMFFMPMIGKVNKDRLDMENDVTDYMMHFQYENPETELGLGIFFDLRVASAVGDDSPAGINGLGGSTAVRSQSFKSQNIGLYSFQKTHDFKIGLEAGILTGNTGVVFTPTGGTASNPSNVSLNGFGVAAEIKYEPAQARWSWLTRAGVASGSDGGINDTYGGYSFNRNYNVAMLLFNHPMGVGNILRTQLQRDVSSGPSSANNASSQFDTETVSNAAYVSESWQDKFKDNASWGGNVIFAQLMAEPYLNGNTARDLGYELDLNLTIKPYERLTWVTEAGFMLPGQAWKGGKNDFNNTFAYGLSTKAAISF